MNQDANQNNFASDDIDLLMLLERVIRFFRRYKRILIISAILGLGAGLFMYFYLPKIYKSKLVAHSFLLTNQEEIKIIENWNTLLKKEEYDELASILNCNKSLIGKVKKITGDEIQKVFSVTNPNGFTVEVSVTDNAILDDLQKAIIYGLENTEYVKRRLDSKRANLIELIDKTAAEVVKLDSTKKIVENIIAGKSKSSSSLIIEGATINKQLIEMNEKLMGYKEDLKFIAAIEVYQGFSKFKEPAGPHLIPWLVIGLLFFMTIGFGVSFLSAINSRLKRHSLLSKQATQQKNI